MVELPRQADARVRQAMAKEVSMAVGSTDGWARNSDWNANPDIQASPGMFVFCYNFIYT